MVRAVLFLAEGRMVSTHATAFLSADELTFSFDNDDGVIAALDALDVQVFVENADGWHDPIIFLVLFNTRHTCY